MKLSDEIIKRLDKEAYYNQDDYIKDVKDYISAAKDGRLLYDVVTVSRSGMSRELLIRAYKKGYYRSFGKMLQVMGYKIKWDNYPLIRVNGCGMSMTFATNYNLIYSFYNMGFLTKKSRDILSQKIN